MSRPGDIHRQPFGAAIIPADADNANHYDTFLNPQKNSHLAPPNATSANAGYEAPAAQNWNPFFANEAEIDQNELAAKKFVANLKKRGTKTLVINAKFLHAEFGTEAENDQKMLFTALRRELPAKNIDLLVISNHTIKHNDDSRRFFKINYYDEGRDIDKTNQNRIRLIRGEIARSSDRTIFMYDDRTQDLQDHLPINNNDIFLARHPEEFSIAALEKLSAEMSIPQRTSLFVEPKRRPETAAPRSDAAARISLQQQNSAMQTSLHAHKSSEELQDIAHHFAKALSQQGIKTVAINNGYCTKRDDEQLEFFRYLLISFAQENIALNFIERPGAMSEQGLIPQSAELILTPNITNTRGTKVLKSPIIYNNPEEKIGAINKIADDDKIFLYDKITSNFEGFIDTSKIFSAQSFNRNGALLPFDPDNCVDETRRLNMGIGFNPRAASAQGFSSQGHDYRKDPRRA